MCRLGERKLEFIHVELKEKKIPFIDLTRTVKANFGSQNVFDVTDDTNTITSDITGSYNIL